MELIDSSRFSQVRYDDETIDTREIVGKGREDSGRKSIVLDLVRVLMIA